MMSSPDDQIRRRDVLQIEDLLQHEDWLRSFVRRLVADPATAADVVQDTWLRALRKPASVRHTKGFLARIARNLVVSRARSRAVRSRHECASAKAEALESAADTVERLEAQRVLTRAIATLPDAERTVVILRHVHGLAPKAVAVQLGLTPDTVRQRCHRGLDRVRAQMRTRLGDDWRKQPGVCALMGVSAYTAAGAAPGIAVGCAIASAIRAIIPTAALWMTAKAKIAAGAASAVVILAVLLWGLSAPSLDGLGSPHGVGTTDQRRAGSLSPDRDRMPTANVVQRAKASVETLAATSSDGAAEQGGLPAILRLEVLDVTGVPIPGCSVFHVPGRSRPPTQTSSALLTADSFVRLGTTGRDGEVLLTLPQTSGFVDVRHPDLSRRWRMVYSVQVGGADTKSVAMTRRVILAPEVTVRGAVQMHDGSSRARRVRITEVARELARVPLPFEDSFRILGTPAEVGPDGSFTVEGLPASSSLLVFAAEREDGVFEDFYRHCVGDRDEYLGVPMEAQQDLEVPRVSVVGRVLTPRGHPISGARVEISTPDGHQRSVDTTDNAGRFSVEDAREIVAKRVLVVSRKGWRPRQIRDLDARLALDASLAGPVTLDIQLDRGVTLVGSVLESNGTPVLGLRVLPAAPRAYPGGRSGDDLHGGREDSLRINGQRIAMQAVTGTDGSFELVGLADEPLHLRVLDLQTGFGWTSHEVWPGRHPVVLRLPDGRMRPRIAGRVVDRWGRGVPRADIGVSTCVRSVGDLQQWRGKPLGRTDDDGAFAFTQVPRNGLRLTVSGTGLLSRDVDVPVSASGDCLEIVVARRCFVRAALSETSAVTSFAMVDGGGERLDLFVKQSGQTETRSKQTVRMGESLPVAVSDEAAAALFFDAAGRQIRRVPVRLAPGRVYELRD